MRYELQVEKLIGYAAHAAAEGQTGLMWTKGFTTPDDGNIFYAVLDGFASQFLDPYLEKNGSVSTIDHCLVLIPKTYIASIYVNEPPLIARAVGKRAIEKGDRVFKSDIAGIDRLQFKGIDIPADCAIAFFFSVGWRRGYFFDFTPLQGGKLQEIDRTLGQMYDRLLFSEIYSIPEPLWSKIFQAGWFPFISLIGGSFEQITGFLEKDILYAWEQTIFSQFDETRLNQRLESWKNSDRLKEHLPFLECGIERYLAGDYLSAISNVWPRVEGVLRFLYTGAEPKPSQRKLLQDMKEVLINKTVPPPSYLPALFEEYLRTFYYRDFTLNKAAVELARHSHSHGVSSSQDYDRKKALVGLLMIDQLFYYIRIGWDENSGSIEPIAE